MAIWQTPPDSTAIVPTDAETVLLRSSPSDPDQTLVTPLTAGTEPEGAIRIPAHKLLRRIGEGSYGTIWLAINAMGTYRAVKVIYRAHFPEDRPYEREYEGIKQFEPLSRSHEGFVDILQVDRNDAEGYFYYVMELADDIHSGQQISPETYIPRTLARAASAPSKLALNECLRIANSLASALEHLHGNNLVHRDIKEANIVFIHGIPKLADIGLVHTINADSSFVGTPGFIPPEGPGTPAADIYSLGKVLYSISTGQDRHKFPVLPDGERLSEQPRIFQDWFSIVLKAAADNVHLRYQSAAELQAHLGLVRAGKSLRRLLQFERGVVLAKRFGLLTLVMALSIAFFVIEVLREKTRAATERQREAGSHVAHGSAAFAAGDYFRALPPFVRALQLDSDDPVREATHRFRIGAALQYSPKLIEVRFRSNYMSDAGFGRSDNQVYSRQPGGRFALWNIHTEETLSALFGPGIYSEEKCALSRDGRRAVTCYDDTSARIWDVESGRLLRTFNHPGWVLNAQFSPDAHKVVTTESGSHEARVWNVENGQQEFLLRGHPHDLFYAAFSPDGRKIVTTSTAGQAIIWDAQTGKSLLTFTGHKRWVQHATFSPDSQWVATGSGDHTARVWDAATGREIVPPLPHDDHIFSVEFSPDQRSLLTSCLDGTAHIWDLKTGQHAFPPLHHQARLRRACFSPSGSRVLTLSIDGDLFLWELRSPTPRLIEAPAAFAGEGSRLGRYRNGQIEIARPLAEQPEITLTAGGAPSRLLMSDSGATLVAQWKNPAGQQELNIWDTRNLAAPLIPILLENAKARLALSPDGKRLAIADNSETATYDTRTAVRLATVRAPAKDSICFDHAGSQLALVQGRTAEVWSLDPEPHRLCTLSTKLNIGNVEFSLDDRQLLTSCFDMSLRAGEAQLWDIPSGHVIHAFTHRDGVRYATFDPSSERIISCGEDYAALLWDAKTGNQSLARPLQHQEIVLFAAFSKSHPWVLTIEKQGILRVWDTISGELVLPPLDPGVPLLSAAFLADERGIAALTIDNNWQIWMLPRELRTAPDLERMAQLLSGEQTRASSSRLSRREEFRRNWQYLQARYPRDFSGPSQVR